jgi:hypothetical protein
METLSQYFPDSTSCLRQFGWGWASIFAKVVLDTDAPLPSRAWHDENGWIAVRARFRQQCRNPLAALRNQADMIDAGYCQVC